MSLNLGFLLLLVNFVSRFRLELIYIYIYIHIHIHTYIYLIYQVRPHLSPSFSAACAATIVHRNHSFPLYQTDKSSESKEKFRQATNCYKRVLEAAKLTYANKIKRSITSHKLGSQDFWQIVNSILNKSKSAIHPLFKDPDLLSSASDKA